MTRVGDVIVAFLQRSIFVGAEFFWTALISKVIVALDLMFQRSNETHLVGQVDQKWEVKSHR